MSATTLLTLMLLLVTLKAASAKLDETATTNNSRILTQRHMRAYDKKQASAKLDDTATTNSSKILAQRHMTANNKEQAYVSSGSLVSFSSQLLAQEKADILDSLLYADLVASDVYDRTTSFTSWYGLYINVLKETGWDIKTLGFRPYSANTNTFTILGMVWELLSPLCREVQKEVSIL